MTRTLENLASEAEREVVTALGRVVLLDKVRVAVGELETERKALVAGMDGLKAAIATADKRQTEAGAVLEQADAELGMAQGARDFDRTERASRAQTQARRALVNAEVAARRARRNVKAAAQRKLEIDGLLEELRAVELGDDAEEVLGLLSGALR